MEVYYSDQPLPIKMKLSIFLVGPTPRITDVPSWRPDALQLLESLKFKGSVFVPENSGKNLVLDEDANQDNLWLKQVEWEREGLDGATVIAAWVPRSQELPAFTTNVEFGRYVTSKRLIYGRPDGAPKTRYLDWLYHRETGMHPHLSLAGLLSHAVRLCEILA